eukprot:3044066-Rhodomonas_salina.1
MPGTDLTYIATPPYAMPAGPSPEAVPGSDIAYDATPRYAKSGTDTAYARMPYMSFSELAPRLKRCPVLT